MSAETMIDDWGRRFVNYRTLGWLCEYVLVSDYKNGVETFYRQPDGVWAIGPTFTGLDKVVHLRSLAIDIPLSEIYANVEFMPEPPRLPDLD